MKNVFLLGLDDFNRHELRWIRGAGDMRVRGLLGYDEIVRPVGGTIAFEALRRKAETELDAFPGTVDGIASFWDFPSSALAGVLRNAGACLARRTKPSANASTSSGLGSSSRRWCPSSCRASRPSIPSRRIRWWASRSPSRSGSSL